MTLPKGWSARVIPSGGRLRSFDPLALIPEEAAADLEARLGKATLAWSAPEADRAVDSGAVGSSTTSLARRILERGTRPPLHPAVERRLLREAGLLEESQGKTPEDFAPRISPGAALPTEWDVLAVADWLAGKPAHQTGGPPPFSSLVLGPAQTTIITQAILLAIDQGWLRAGETWTIAISDSTSSAPTGLVSALELIGAAETLTGESLVPRECRCSVNDGRPLILRRVDALSFEARPGPSERLRPDLQLAIEPEEGPDHDMPAARSAPTVVARAAGDAPGRGPSDLTATSDFSVADSSSKTRAALEWILQLVFAKPTFRPGQLDAIERLLDGETGTLSLPPGEGKSIVYQLGGILRPGLTLVISASDLLSEGQQALLEAQGLDHITRFQEAPAERPSELPAAREPHFALVTSADLRRAAGRNDLESLIGTSPVGLVAYDDAECLSQWSDRFDPAHSDLLAPILRSSGVPPETPVIALTNDLQPEILRDVLAQLGGSRARPFLIEAPSDPSQSCEVEIVSARADQALAALQKMLRSLPKRFGMPAKRFFDATRQDSPRGVILCSRVDGTFGLPAVYEAIRETGICPRLGLYASETPDGLDDAEFRLSSQRDLDDFRAGRLPLMVAATDLGYSLDPSNLSYVVHFGLPRSLDALRAQSGRLHDPTRPLERFIITVPESGRTVSRLLAPETDHRELVSSIGKRKGLFAEPDDLMRSIANHVECFIGEEEEIAELEKVLDLVSWEQHPDKASVPLGEEPASRKLALYRLARLGVIRDWLEDEGDLVLTLRADAHRVLEQHFWKSVLQTGPDAARELYAQGPGSEEFAPFAETLIERSRRLVSVVYRYIETGRRRSIAELASFVGAGGTQKLADPSERLLERTPRRLETVSSDDGRGIAAWSGALDYAFSQDVPALKQILTQPSTASETASGPALVRALLEILDPGDSAAFHQHLRTTLERAHVENGKDWGTLQRLFCWLMPRVRAWAPDRTVSLWTAWEEAAGELGPDHGDTWPPHLLREFEIESLTDVRQSPNEAIIVLERRLREAQAVLATLTEHYAMEESDL